MPFYRCTNLNAENGEMSVATGGLADPYLLADALYIDCHMSYSHYIGDEAVDNHSLNICEPIVNNFFSTPE